MMTRIVRIGNLHGLRIPQPLLALLFLCLGCSAEATGQTPIALTGVTVIDGTGAPARPGMTIVIEGERIAAVFPTGSQALPVGVRTLDVAGSYVIPGLIDSHVHLATFDRPDNVVNAILRYALLGGVTSVRDMGGNPERVQVYARASRAADAVMPRVYGSAVFAGPRWFATYDTTRLAFWSGDAPVGAAPGVRRIDGSTDIAAAVRAAEALGVQGIKLYSDLPPAHVEAIIREADSVGLLVWSHAVSEPTRPQDISAGGAVSLSHADQLIWNALPSGSPAMGARDERARLMERIAPDGPELAPLYRALAERGTLLEPTLLVMQMGGIRDGRLGPLGLVQAWAVGATRAAHRAGVPIVAGTDAIGQRTPYIHTELQLLVDQVGLTPLEAIQAATQHGARALGIADSTGTIVAGKWADLVVLSADPSADVRNTQTVRMVIRGGQVHERREAWEVPPGAKEPLGRLGGRDE
jgi:hypothetical protein